MSRMQTQPHAQEPTHPFDMEKSEFEKLLERAFRNACKVMRGGGSGLLRAR